MTEDSGVHETSTNTAKLPHFRVLANRHNPDMADVPAPQVADTGLYHTVVQQPDFQELTKTKR